MFKSGIKSSVSLSNRSIQCAFSLAIVTCALVSYFEVMFLLFILVTSEFVIVISLFLF